MSRVENSKSAEDGVSATRRPARRGRLSSCAWAPRLASLSLLAGVLCAGCAQEPIRHTTRAKLSSQLWRDARRADALGLTPTATLSSAPVSKGDLARGLSDAHPLSRRGREEEPSPSSGGESPGRTLLVSWALLPGIGAWTTAAARSDVEWFERAQERHRARIEDVWEETGCQSTALEPLEELSVEYVYAKRATWFYNQLGREYNPGSNLYLSGRATARLWSAFAFAAEPEFSFLQTSNSDGEGDGTTHGAFRELSASVRTWVADVEVGRIPMWWGPSRHGSLLLSTNAQPLDVVRVATPGPVLLPGFLGHLGLIRGETFLTRLYDDRAIPRPYLWGARLSTRVLPWLEVGASRTALFGGKGRAVKWRTFWDVWTAHGEDKPEGPGDQRASFDARLVVPWWVQPFELYGELGGEDEAGYLPSKFAHLAGIYLPRIGPWHALELTVEFADTEVSGHPGVWYRNASYPDDGYRYEGRIIGHHVGTDGRDLYAELRVHPFGDETSITAAYNYEARSWPSSVTEKLHQLRLGLEGRVYRKLWIAGFFERDFWKNYGQVAGASEGGTAFGLAAWWRF